MRGLEVEKNVFVAHFDILGMSSVLRKSNDRAWLLLCDLAEACEIEELPLSVEMRENLGEKFFSDTIILHACNDDTASLRSIVARSFEIFRSAFRVGIPLRAGIAHGAWIEAASGKQDLFTGDALLRAYHIGETQQLNFDCDMRCNSGTVSENPVFIQLWLACNKGLFYSSEGWCELESCCPKLACALSTSSFQFEAAISQCPRKSFFRVREL